MKAFTNFLSQTFFRLSIFSITKKITLLLLLMIGVITLSIILFFNTYIKPTISQEYLANVKILHQQYDSDIRASINKESNTSLQDIYTKVVDNPYISSVYIETKEAMLGEPLKYSKSDIAYFENEEASYFSIYSDTKHGFYILAINADSYKNRLTEYRDFIIYLSIFMAFISIVVAINLKILLLPLTKLSILLKAKQLPPQHVMPDINSNDERGDLVNAFKKFTRSHQVYANQLNVLNHRLEKTIREKNSQIRLLKEDMNSQVGAEVEKNRNKEKILHEQSRFAAMGEMLGNIAHQWRQPLSAINTAIGNVKIENMLGVTTKESLNETFENIEEYTDYLSNTIEDFRSYFKVDKQRKNYYMSEVIETVISLTRGNFQDITISKEYNDGNMKILGYPNEMMQVIINIMNNAKDIFEEKHIARQYIKITIDKSTSHLIVKFFDNAGGIDKSIIGSIFDPYFTTKHKAQGTGIGLYMSKEIIQKHMQGSLSVSNKGFYINNEEQFGACFSIALPLN